MTKHLLFIIWLYTTTLVATAAEPSSYPRDLTVAYIPSDGLPESSLSGENRSSAPAEEFVVIKGYVKDYDSKKRMDNVSVSVPGSTIGTITNDEGFFTLKIPARFSAAVIKAEQTGYHSRSMSIGKIKDRNNLILWLRPAPKMLKEVVVRWGKPDEIVEEALKRIPDNYYSGKSMFSAFYRETIKKGKRYIGVSEAITDVYKTSYSSRSIYGERVQIRKGRTLISQDKKDTLSVKIAGGPILPVIIDFVKNKDLLFSGNDLHLYEFTMENPVMLDDRMQFVIRFKPKVKQDYAMCKGLLYIDQEMLAFSKAEFELDMSDKDKATRVILRKKPRGLHFKPQEMSFIVTYLLDDSVSYINYVSTTTRFKCDWKRRLFSSGYTTQAEMVMVERTDMPDEGISRKNAFHNYDVFADKVNSYWDVDFWKDYNIIEPTESLEKAVDKLKSRNARFSMSHMENN